MALQKPKSPWMRMTSNYYEGDPSDRRILMGGDTKVNQSLSFGFSGMYNAGSQTGEIYRPDPTIESISVEERFDTADCTITWKAYSLEQLERLYPYFMNPGATLFVDWGWSDVPPSSVVDVGDENAMLQIWQSYKSDQTSSVQPSNPQTNTRYKGPYDHPKFEALKKGRGRYGFAKGGIVNAEYTPEEQNVFSCTTEILSLPKAMAKFRSKGQIHRRSKPKGGGKIKKSLDEYLEQDFIKELGEVAAGDSGDVVVFSDSGIVSALRNFSGFGSGYHRTDAGENNDAYYVSWKYVEQTLAKYVQQKSAGGGVDLMRFDSSTSIISNFWKGDGDGKLDLRTTDPFVCLLDSSGKTSALRTFSKEGELAAAAKKPGSKGVDPQRQGFLYNLYIHYELLIQAFQTQETVIDAMKFVLDLASEACFGIWDFELLDVSNRYQFIDKNSPVNTVDDLLNSQNDTFKFRVNRMRSIVRDFSFDMQLDDIIKSQIMIQKYSEVEGDPAMNDRNDSTTLLFRDTFKGKDLVLNQMAKENEKTEEAQAGPGDAKPTPDAEDEDGSNLKLEGDYEDQAKKLSRVIGSTTNADITYYNKKEDGASKASDFSVALQADRDKRSAVNGSNLINVGLEMTLDGISGFCTYQVLEFVGIPSIFKNNGMFFIESINQDVSASDWTTKIKTQYSARNLTDG